MAIFGNGVGNVTTLHISQQTNYYETEMLHHSKRYIKCVRKGSASICFYPSPWWERVRICYHWMCTSFYPSVECVNQHADFQTGGFKETQRKYYIHNCGKLVVIFLSLIQILVNVTINQGDKQLPTSLPIPNFDCQGWFFAGDLVCLFNRTSRTNTKKERRKKATHRGVLWIQFKKYMRNWKQIWMKWKTQLIYLKLKCFLKIPKRTEHSAKKFKNCG